MWSDGEYCNENGDQVRLYLPILYSPEARTNASRDPAFSHVGGAASYFPGDELVEKESPVCSTCGDEMCLLVQLSSSSSGNEGALYVFGCNKASCCSGIFNEGENTFSQGGNGVFICRRSHQPRLEEKSGFAPKVTGPISPPVESPWGTEGQANPSEDAATNDWAMEDTEVGGMDDVAAMVTAMEVKGLEPRKKLVCPPFIRRTDTGRHAATRSDATANFPCFEIHSQPEPTAKRASGMDDDDVGMGSSSDDKIQQMLARYMAEEDDEEILAALRGSAGPTEGTEASGGGRKEKDERLSAEDRTILTFTDRVKREPRQVVRYAKGGAPLWSIPLPKEFVKKRGDRSKKKKSMQSQRRPIEMRIPSCSCGEKRIFAFQVMPSLLHVLDVDENTASRKKTTGKSETKVADDAMKRAFDEGGMNWGAIAVYVCPQMCNASRQEYLIVQDSVDGRPEKRMGATEDAMVDDTTAIGQVGEVKTMDEEEMEESDDSISDCNEDLG